VPARDARLADALLELQELTRRLRRDCPWDREQTARTIVPHTVEEAYEVADAAAGGDPAKLLY
jgi:nucleoside triphosphate diphosphatase